MSAIPVVALVLPLLLAGQALAQDGARTLKAQNADQERRQPIFGRVLDAQGRPVAGAEVHLVSNLVRGLPELGGNDVLRLETDTRGRFRVGLLRGRGYSAWASCSGLQGKLWSSKVTEDVRPGPALDLCLFASRPSPTLHLSPGRDDMRFGKVTCLMGGKHFVLRPLNGVEANNLILPRLAGDRTTLRIMDVEGRPLQARGIRLARLGSKTSLELIPGKRRQVRMRVLDGGKAVAGVEITLFMNSWRAVLATTDDDGYAEFPIEGNVNARTKKFRSTRACMLCKPGYPATQIHIEGPTSSGNETLEVSVTLTPSRRLRGRILDAEGKGRSGLPLVLFTLADRLNRGKRSTTSLLLPLTDHTDDQGRFDLAGLNRHSAHRLLAIPKDGSLPILISSQATPLDEDLDLGDLRPTNFLRVDLAITDPFGRPIRDARLVLGEAGSKRGDRRANYFPFWLYPDRGGEAVLLCRRGLRPAFAAGWQGAIAEVTPDLSRSKGATAAVEVRLPTLIRLSGQLFHKDLKSYSGAMVELSLNRFSRPSLRVSSALMSVPPLTVGQDGSFQFYVEPGAKVMFWIYYDDPDSGGKREYYSSVPKKVYQEDTGSIRLDLDVRAKRSTGRSSNIGIGGGK